MYRVKYFAAAGVIMVIASAILAVSGMIASSKGMACGRMRWNDNDDRSQGL